VETWSRAHDELVESLRALIRIPSINPPDPPGGELEAARWIAATLSDAGLRPEVFEPFPGRGSVVARLRGDASCLADWLTKVNFLDEKLPVLSFNLSKRVGQETRYSFVEMAVGSVNHNLPTF